MKTLIIFVIMLSAPFVYANDHDVDLISFTFENDAFFRDDGLYSNGLFLAWGYNDVNALDNETLPSWIAYLAQKSNP